MVWVDVNVPQAELMQLSNDLLQHVGVLIGGTIHCTGTGSRSWHLWVGEVEQANVARQRDDLVSVGGVQRGVPTGGNNTQSRPESACPWR